MLQTLYTILLYLIQPFVLLRLWIKGRKLPAYRKRWGERYGFCAGKIKPHGLLLHSVSVGETLAAIPLVRALQHRYPSLPITITTMTPTGSERVISAFGNSVSHVYIPYDLPGAIKRFLNEVKPQLVIIMETELWPNLITQLYKRNTPLLLANARLSERSLNGYSKIPGFTRKMLRRITFIAAQNSEDAQRFLELGVKRNHLSVIGSLKFDISVTPELAAKTIALRRQWAPYRFVWIAASTHEGEELLILQAHKRLLKTFPELLLILVPRHPERFNEAVKLTKEMGLTYVLRSTGEIPNLQVKVIIGDTMGELMLLYGIADLAFVGGSFVEKGGHNPLEPAAHAIPVLMGPSRYNFNDITAKLMKEGGLIIADNDDALVKEIATLLNDEDYRHYTGRHAANVLYHNQGSLNKLMDLIQPYLPY